MFDPFASEMRAIAAHSVYAPALALLCGAISSAGPCAASRFVAVASLSANRSGRGAFALAGTYIAGVAAVYMCFGASASLLGRIAALSHAIYFVVAAALGAGGVATLWRQAARSPHECERAGSGASLGAAFMLGVSGAFVVSPCCTPLLSGILAYTSQAGDPAYGALMLAVFAVGHCAPVLAAGFGASLTGASLKRYAASEAAAVVSGALMLALAGYYAVLA